MDMGGEQAVGEVVRLVYRVTPDDIADALRARDRKTPAGRRRQRGYVGCAAGLLLLAVLTALGREGVRPISFGLVAGAATLGAFALYGPRLQARAFGGMLEKVGEVLTVVDDSGVLATTADTQTRIGWSAQPAYAETDRAFVMLSADKQAVGMTCLPKRGAQDPADIDRLRAVLDRNLKRL
ncbi:YcxB family protein [Streptomyces sp. NBC_01408]|uniref:YcxB family protein n=1 Tax=Streptomyces sp. NBC_01408 TaxID=2903855 RepID=UPI0022569C34|nr:YcxB family protein [Streptomyces sp. NBC_01408]MCX4693443.1 YcxB family protein [Streptomyces sp. NBC_01408]